MKLQLLDLEMLNGEGLCCEVELAEQFLGQVPSLELLRGPADELVRGLWNQLASKIDLPTPELDAKWRHDMREFESDPAHVGHEGRMNIWTCSVCHYAHRCEDVDVGVTPFMIDCQRPACKGKARSAVYRVARNVQPEFEWFRPSSLSVVPRSWRRHLEQGGLLMRRVGQHEAVAIREQIERAGTV